MTYWRLVFSVMAGLGLVAVTAGVAHGYLGLVALGALLLAPGLASWLKWARTPRKDIAGGTRPESSAVDAPKSSVSRPMRAWEFASCKCLSGAPLPPTFHSEVQDTSADGWKVLLDVIERAEREQAEVFDPLATMTNAQIAEVVTLPPSLGRLKSVKHLVLDGSWTVRLPPQIGEMSSLEEFIPYQSYRLHWLPYELTRCANLKLVVISRRALYGQRAQPELFPRLPGARGSTVDLDLNHLDPTVYGVTTLTECSVCRHPIAGSGLHQGWIVWGLQDTLPLLVNACSQACLARASEAPVRGWLHPPALPGVNFEVQH